MAPEVLRNEPSDEKYAVLFSTKLFQYFILDPLDINI